MMKKRNLAQKIRAGLLLMLLLTLAMPVLAQANEIVIAAKQNLALQSKPDYDSDVLGVFQRGEEATAFGRNGDGSWLHIAEGWVVAKNVDAAGDLMTLPVTTDAVTVKAANRRSLRSGPDGSFDVTGELPGGEAALALGRNSAGSWLQVAAGWIPADQVTASGDIFSLPVTFASITIAASYNVALHRGPSRDAEVTAILERGASKIAVARSDDGAMLQTPDGWVFVNRGLQLDGDVMALPAAHTVSVTAAQAVTLYRGPSQDSGRLAVVQPGEQTIAFGRDEAGAWLQIPGGWVSAAPGLELEGDVMRLPITGRAGIIVTSGYNVPVRSRPSSANSVRRLQSGEEALAIGRNERGNWLQIESGGWILAAFLKANGDIMSLPVTSEESTSAASSTTTSTRRTAPTPIPSAAFDGQTIRSLVSRYTDDIRILNISQRGGATEIEYRIKSWPFVPNETIAEEVMFKVICALRRGGQIPHRLEFMGQGNFKSDVGRKFTSPSVEIHISASNANRIVCGGNDPADINWRRLSSLYKSYPIPSGASVDYD